jgi:hypothetical protein
MNGTMVRSSLDERLARHISDDEDVHRVVRLGTAGRDAAASAPLDCAAPGDGDSALTAGALLHSLTHTTALLSHRAASAERRIPIRDDQRMGLLGDVAPMMMRTPQA